MRRVLIISNKTWEAEPLINALLNPEFKPKELLVPQQLNHPRKNGQIEYIPRATICYKDIDITYEIWCIQDLMDSNMHPSSSEEKYRSLPYAINFRNRKEPDFILAFGTAGFLVSPDDPINDSNNGCVAIGTNVFIHDGHPLEDENPYSKLHISGKFEKELLSQASNRLIEQLLKSPDFLHNVEKRLLKPFLMPSNNIRLIIKQNLLALSNINVTNYTEYERIDIEGVQSVINSGTKSQIGSIETTHGIIKILTESPFIFISGITDRVGHFNEDVTPKKESQNYTCAFNAGITTAWIIPEIIKYLS